MAILPPNSKDLVPEQWSKLMIDPESEIVSFYPKEFKIDLNGKKFPWQGVAILPFVDYEKLTVMLDSVYNLLTAEELCRNRIGHNLLFLNTMNKLYDFIVTSFEGSTKSISLDLKVIPGTLLLSEDTVYPKMIIPSPLNAFPDLVENQVVCLKFTEKDTCFTLRSDISDADVSSRNIEENPRLSESRHSHAPPILQLEPADIYEKEFSKADVLVTELASDANAKTVKRRREHSSIINQEGKRMKMDDQQTTSKIEGSFVNLADTIISEASADDSPESSQEKDQQDKNV